MLYQSAPEMLEQQQAFIAGPIADPQLR
jgi:hypothetical protein